MIALRSAQVGWIDLLVDGGVLGLLPIITFRRKGGVAKGESYIKTTVLVYTGIYAIVRHHAKGAPGELFAGIIRLLRRTGKRLPSENQKSWV